LAKKYLPTEIINRPKFPYRAIINSKNLLNNQKVNSAIAEHKITKYNVFNYQAVNRFLNKLKAKTTTTEKELMLLVFIISTQMLLQNGGGYWYR
jgi:asparagine synthase (glutamine-hydrolysing)